MLIPNSNGHPNAGVLPHRCIRGQAAAARRFLLSHVCHVKKGSRWRALLGRLQIASSKVSHPMSNGIDSANEHFTREARRHWMAVLARASTEQLERAWRTVATPPEHQWLRRPETGLAMLRGRAGGTGAQFNLGEASVTRCALRVTGDSGHAGFAYVLGRDHRHAELAALFDALLQDDQRGPGLQQTIIKSLADGQARQRDDASRKAAATRVDFYTMVRGASA